MLTWETLEILQNSYYVDHWWAAAPGFSKMNNFEFLQLLFTKPLFQK